MDAEISGCKKINLPFISTHSDLYGLCENLIAVMMRFTYVKNVTVIFLFIPLPLIAIESETTRHLLSKSTVAGLD